MKKIILFSMLLIIPAIGFSQTQADYENVMHKFMTFYNNNQPDSIVTLYSESAWGKHPIKPLWDMKKNDYFKKLLGALISYKYVGIDPKEHVRIFDTKFQADSACHMSFHLEPDKKFGTFRISPSK